MNNHNYTNTAAHPLARSAYKNLRDDTEDSIRFVLRAINELSSIKATRFEPECVDALERFREDVTGHKSSRAYARWRNEQPDAETIPKLNRILSTFGRWSSALDACDGNIEARPAWRWRGHTGSKFSAAECLDALDKWLSTLQFRRDGLEGYFIYDGDEDCRLAIPPQMQAYRHWAIEQDLADRIPLTADVIAKYLGGTWLAALHEANARGNHDPQVRAVLEEELKTRAAKRETALALLAEAITESNCQTVRGFDQWAEAEADRTEDLHRIAWLVTHPGRRISDLFPTWGHALKLAADKVGSRESVDHATRRRIVAAAVLCTLELDRRPTRREYELWRELKPNAEEQRIPSPNTIRRCFDTWDEVLDLALGGGLNG